MTTAKRILITGATGKQGGALLSALLESPPTPPFHLVALTRNASSAKAQALDRHPNVSVLEGDLDDPRAIFTMSKEPIYGVFSVQTPLKPKIEEQQGKALVDVAAANGVKHFVYTSAERGGPERSDRDGTPVKHFISKFNIEKHLKEVGKRTPEMQWTIIRPVAFMDNLTPDFLGRAFMAMWKLNGMDTKLQLVSSKDIGKLAAESFKNPEAFVGKAISLATDELTPREANDIFRKIVGDDVPSSYSTTGRLVKLLLREQLGVMFDWFKEVGFGADPGEFRSKIPEMQNFERWLKESSAWKTPASKT